MTFGGCCTTTGVGLFTIAPAAKATPAAATVATAATAPTAATLAKRPLC